MTRLEEFRSPDRPTLPRNYIRRRVFHRRYNHRRQLRKRWRTTRDAVGCRAKSSRSMNAPTPSCLFSSRGRAEGRGRAFTHTRARIYTVGPGSPTMMPPPHLRHARRGETRWRRRITSRPTPVASVMHPIEYSTGDGAGKRGTRNGPQARQHHPRPLRRTTSPVYLRRVRFKWPGMDGMLPAMLKSVQN